MAIKKRPTSSAPFLNRESALKALGEHYIVGTDITRGGMYLLNIINSLIQDGNHIFERIPQEVLSGLSKGGRRNVQASVICRAKGSTDGSQHDRYLDSGYTVEQELIGHWAERDGCWSDTPEGDLTRTGRKHQSRYDGSEARIFYDGSDTVYKTINFLRYPSAERFLDRIAIHNTYFPETQLTVEAFGVRDFSDDASEFCVTVRQPFIQGKRPTEKQIEEGMAKRGLVSPPFGAGLFFTDGKGNTLITDVNKNNAVFTEKGNLQVFDCEAMLFDSFGGKYKIPKLKYSDAAVEEIRQSIDVVLPKSVSVREILPTIPEDKQPRLIHELTHTGRLEGLLEDGPWAYHAVQIDPEDPDKLLLSRSGALRLFFRMHDPVFEDGKKLSREEQQAVFEGRSFRRGNCNCHFDLDKGRIVEKKEILKLKLSHKHEVDMKEKNTETKRKGPAMTL